MAGNKVGHGVWNRVGNRIGYRVCVNFKRDWQHDDKSEETYFWPFLFGELMLVSVVISMLVSYSNN